MAKNNRSSKRLMSTEKPQVQQLWHCKQCGYVTSHRVNGGTHEDRKGMGINRVHECEDCGHELSTLELRRERIVKVRIALMHARSSAKKLLDSLDDARKSAANDLLSLEEAIATLENREPIQSRPIPRPTPKSVTIGKSLL